MLQDSNYAGLEDCMGTLHTQGIEQDEDRGTSGEWNRVVTIVHQRGKENFASIPHQPPVIIIKYDTC